jgi:uncharacterized protein YjbJ (UPF0337 family)
MNWDQVQGNWTQFKGKTAEIWGKFADDALNVRHGTREQFVGRLQEKSDLKREEAEKKLDKKLRDRMVARLRQEEQECFGP